MPEPCRACAMRTEAAASGACREEGRGCVVSATCKGRAVVIRLQAGKWWPHARPLMGLARAAPAAPAAVLAAERDGNRSPVRRGCGPSCPTRNGLHGMVSIPSSSLRHLACHAEGQVPRDNAPDRARLTDVRWCRQCTDPAGTICGRSRAMRRDVFASNRVLRPGQSRHISGQGAHGQASDPVGSRGAVVALGTVGSARLNEDAANLPALPSGTAPASPEQSHGRSTCVRTSSNCVRMLSRPYRAARRRSIASQMALAPLIPSKRSSS